jgi:hypothetical protein
MHLRWYIYRYMDSLGVLGDRGGSIIVLIFSAPLRLCG